MEAHLPSKHESNESVHRGDRKSLSKEERIVTVTVVTITEETTTEGTTTEVGIPPPDGGTRAWLVLAGVSLSVASIFSKELNSWAGFLSEFLHVCVLLSRSLHH